MGYKYNNSGRIPFWHFSHLNFLLKSLPLCSSLGAASESPFDFFLRTRLNSAKGQVFSYKTFPYLPFCSCSVFQNKAPELHVSLSHAYTIIHP